MTSNSYQSGPIPLYGFPPLCDGQRAAWLKQIEAFDESTHEQCRLALFAADETIPAHALEYGVQVRLKDFELRRPRQWGACWGFCRCASSHRKNRGASLGSERSNEIRLPRRLPPFQVRERLPRSP